MDIAEDVKDTNESESSHSIHQHNSMETGVITVENGSNEDDGDDAEKWNNLMKRCKLALSDFLLFEWYTENY